MISSVMNNVTCQEQADPRHKQTHRQQADVTLEDRFTELFVWVQCLSCLFLFCSWFKNFSSFINFFFFFLPLSLSWCAVSERSISCWLQTSLPGVRKECTVLYVMFTMHHLFCCLFYVTYILNSIYELYIPLQSWSIQFLTKAGRCTRFLLSTSTFFFFKSHL